MKRWGYRHEEERVLLQSIVLQREGHCPHGIYGLLRTVSGNRGGGKAPADEYRPSSTLWRKV